MSVANSLPRAPLSQLIRDQLLSRIMLGELKSGDRLIELKIAAEFSTSQAPVREAIRELETMGVVETLPNKGARVRTITNDELRQLYDVRAQLEAYATELVTELGVPMKSKLMQAIKAMKRAARSADSIAFANHNSSFHRTIVENAGNQVLLELWDTLNVQARTMTNVTRTKANLTELADSHIGIVDAIASGNIGRAKAIAREHVLTNKPDRSR